MFNPIRKANIERSNMMDLAILGFRISFVRTNILVSCIKLYEHNSYAIIFPDTDPNIASAAADGFRPIQTIPTAHDVGWLIHGGKRSATYEY